MARYIALVEQDEVGYGASFPDCPGCVAQAETLDETLVLASEALSEWMADRSGDGFAIVPASTLAEISNLPEVRHAIAAGAMLLGVPLLLDGGRSVEANLSLDAALLAEIDKAAKERRISRSAFLASAARQKIALEG